MGKDPKWPVHLYRTRRLNDQVTFPFPLGEVTTPAEYLTTLMTPMNAPTHSGFQLRIFN
jgi:hypothetical protein